MRILIIGGAGYIGSHVTLELLDQGHTTEVFDNLSSGVRENLFPNTGFFHGDILQKEQLRGCMKERGPFDCVIHLAAFKAAGESMIAPEKYSVNNIIGTLNILNAMVEAGIEHFVFSSSAAVYGEPEYFPMDEEHPCNPENYYGFTKLEIERFLGWYSKLRGIRFAALRYFNAAGYDFAGRVTGLEQNPANLLPVIMEVAAGWRPALKIFGTDFDTADGSGVRDYVHVSDLARAHVSAMNYINEKKKNIIVNLGNETGISVLEMLESTRSITGQPIVSEVTGRRPGDTAKLVASSQKAHKELGWEARESDVNSLVSSTWKVYLPHRK